MRNMIARGRVEKGEWVYGLPIESKLFFDDNVNTICIVTKSGLQWVDGLYMTYEDCITVEANSIGWFTGLTDKNGVKIFEGDIVNVKACSCSFTGCVIYWSEEARYACKTKSGIRYAICARLEFEVIGNIYDNPELLEVNNNE